LYFIGMSLSKALNTGDENFSVGRSSILILIIFLVIGLITVIGGFKLKRKAAMFYIGFCILLSIAFIVTFMSSYGALGYKSEIFILCIGMTYLGLGYLAKRKI
jgi:hypothetical protein